MVRIPVDLSFSNFSLWSSESKFLILCRDMRNFLFFIFWGLDRGSATLTAQVGDAEVGKSFTDGMTEIYKCTVWSVNDGLSGNLRKPAAEVSGKFPAGFR